MGRKSKFSKQQKIEICRRYLDGSESVISLAKEINAGKNTVKSGLESLKRMVILYLMKNLQMNHIQKSLNARL